jgi:hypothetical protein
VTTRFHWFVLVGLLLCTIGGFGWLYTLRLNRGDSFPEYSSLRADPMGTRVLHDGLAALPELRVTRRFRAMAAHEVQTARAVLMLGMSPQSLETPDAQKLDTIERAARNGSRVVIALRAPDPRDESDEEETEREQREARKKQRRQTADKKVPEPVDLKKRWSIELDRAEFAENAQREPGVSDALPKELRWRKGTSFRLSSDSTWQPIYQTEDKPVIVERRFGLGSVVLLADAYVVSNEALQRERSTALLTWLVGTHAEIEFDEFQLGVVKDEGVAGLARRYVLAGALFALVVAAVLFIWHRMALFIPPPLEHAEVALTYHQTAGLEALLRRALSPAELSSAAVAEWRRTAAPGDIARVETALRTLPADSSPVTTNNTLVRVLRRRI